MTGVLRYGAHNMRHRLRGARVELYRLLRIGAVAELRARRMRAVRWDADGVPVAFEPVAGGDLGVLSRRVVTNAGVAFMVDAFQGLASIADFNWHASGTGTVAEAVGDTALGTEVATRQSGTKSEPAANQYRTTATISYTATLAITEHGLFSANASGTLWDRSVFAAINVDNGDAIEFQYTLTLNAGG